MLRKTIASAAVLAAAVSLAGPLAGSAAAADVDSYYPTKGDNAIDVASYDLSLLWRPGERKLTGTATIKLRARTTASSFTLDLDAPLTVSSLTVGGLRTGFTHSGKDLVVNRPVVAGTSYDLVVKYAGKPRTVGEPTSRKDATGLGWHTTGDGRTWTMQKPYGAYTWFPVNDHPSDKALYSIRLNVPDKWVGVANGKLLSRVTSGGRTITRFSEDRPMASYLVTVAIGPYQRYTQTGPHSLPLTYWLPAGRKDLLGPLRATPTAISYLEKQLGPYPFSRAGVIVTPGKSSVETQTLITLAQDNYRYGSTDVAEQVAHNLAHAWYGASVSPNDWRDLWLTEGPATYLQARYAVSRGWDTWTYWQREFSRNDDYYRELYGAPGSYVRTEFGQRNVTYGGALVLLKLRAKMGATPFNQLLREFPKTYAGRSSGRAAFGDLAVAKSGNPAVKTYLNTWLTAKHTPAS